MRPKAFIDVDGVINLIRGDDDPTLEIVDVPEQLARLNAPDITMLHVIQLAPSIRTHLTQIDSLFECNWVTGWGEKAPKLLAPVLGVGANWPVVPLPENQAKLSAVLRCAQGERFLWIDD